MNFYAKAFNELTTTQLYEILRSRSQIFMLEQRIVCQDMDRTDYVCQHLFLEENNEVIAYMRAFYSPHLPNTVCLGRVLSLHHGQGLGTLLMEKGLSFVRENMPCTQILIHSQQHAVGFYKKFGFAPTSEPFLEENVWHVEMTLTY